MNFGIDDIVNNTVFRVLIEALEPLIRSFKNKSDDIDNSISEP